MRSVNNRSGIYVVLTALICLMMSFSFSWEQGSTGITSETLKSSTQDHTGTRNNTDVSVTGITYEGGIPGWDIQEESRRGNYSIGIVGKTTHFTVTVRNNKAQQIDDVDVLCEIRTAETVPEFQIQEVYNVTRNIANIAGNAAVNVHFSHRFLFSFLYNITASVNVTGDGDRTNDNFSLYGWANKWADDCEDGEGVWTHMNRMGGPDTWHIVDNPIDQNGDHTREHAWYVGGANGQYQNNLDAELISPEFDLSHMRTSWDYFEYPVTYAFKMAGDRADVNDKFYIDDLTSDNFNNVRNIFSEPGEVGVFNQWSFMRWYSDLNANGQEDPGEPTGLGVPVVGFWGNQMKTIRFRFRFTSDGAGVSRGYYVDDIIIFGLETYVEDITPLPQIQNVVTRDRPFDGGGHLYVGWDKCYMWDFERYDLYASMSPITDVGGMTPLISNITDAGNATHLIDAIEGGPLQNDVMYYFAVTATDMWGNVDTAVLNGSGKCIDNLPLGVTGLTGHDTPDDEGFNVHISWDPNTSPDFSHYNVYMANEQITSLESLVPVALGVNVTEMDFGNLTNDEGYFFAVTSVDESLPGNENNTVTGQNVIGPVIPVDNLPPPPVTNIIAFDTPDDSGSSLQVSWDECTSLDFDHYKVYIDDEHIVNVTSMPAEVDGLAVNYTVLTKASSNKLLDETDYYIAVVAVDTSGNYLRETISSSPAACYENIPPQPITIMDAYDVPDDEGGMITLRWLSSVESDFKNYNIYISNQTFTSVEGMEPEVVEDNVTTQSKVIYRMDGRPLIDLEEEYWFAVTAVDERGNMDPEVDCYGPVICMENIPPEPIYIADAYDTPNDAGGSITVEIEKSEEEDVVSYELYVRRTVFTDILGRLPEKVIDASEWGNQSIFTTVITTMNGNPLENNRDYYIAVSAIDLSGNQGTEVVPFLPVQCMENMPPERVSDLFSYDRPDDGGGMIMVGWNGSEEADFAYYEIYVFDRNVTELLDEHIPFKASPDQSEPFSSYIGTRDDNLFEVDKYQGRKLVNGDEYWVAVVVYDTLYNFDANVICFGPVSPVKNIVPRLEIPGSFPAEMEMFVGDTLRIKVNVTDPLEDYYTFRWSRKGRVDGKFTDDDYRIPLDKAVDFNITVELVGDDDLIYDSFTWNITVVEPPKETTSAWDTVKSNAVPTVVGLLVILFVIILLVLLMVLRKKRRRRKEEEEEGFAVPRHILPEDHAGGAEGEAGPVKDIDLTADSLYGRETVDSHAAAAAPGEVGAGTPDEPVMTGDMLDSGVDPGMLALPPHEGGEDLTEDGKKDLEDIFAPLDRPRKRVALLPSGERKSTRMVRRKIRRKKVKALPPHEGEGIVEGEGDTAGEEADGDIIPGEVTEAPHVDDEVGKEMALANEGDLTELDTSGEDADLTEKIAEQGREYTEETAAELAEGTEPEETELADAPEIASSLEGTAPEAEMSDTPTEEIVPGETRSEVIEGEKEELDLSDEKEAETAGETAQPDQDPESRLQEIAQQYELVQQQALAVREELSRTEDPGEQQALIEKYNEFEQQVGALQQQANALQAQNVGAEAADAGPITVQCYSCETLLTVEDTNRPIAIICPSCGAESMLES